MLMKDVPRSRNVNERCSKDKEVKGMTKLILSALLIILS